MLYKANQFVCTKITIRYFLPTILCMMHVMQHMQLYRSIGPGVHNIDPCLYPEVISETQWSRFDFYILFFYKLALGKYIPFQLVLRSTTCYALDDFFTATAPNITQKCTSNLITYL